MKNYQNLIGKQVTVKNCHSWWDNEWGTVVDVDGDEIYVAMANDMNTCPVFYRHELKLMKK